MSKIIVFQVSKARMSISIPHSLCPMHCYVFSIISLESFNSCKNIQNGFLINGLDFDNVCDDGRNSCDIYSAHGSHFADGDLCILFIFFPLVHSKYDIHCPLVAAIVCVFPCADLSEVCTVHVRGSLCMCHQFVWIAHMCGHWTHSRQIHTVAHFAHDMTNTGTGHRTICVYFSSLLFRLFSALSFSSLHSENLVRMKTENEWTSTVTTNRWTTRQQANIKKSKIDRGDKWDSRQCCNINASSPQHWLGQKKTKFLKIKMNRSRHAQPATSSGDQSSNHRAFILTNLFSNLKWIKIELFGWAENMHSISIFHGNWCRLFSLCFLLLLCFAIYFSDLLCSSWVSASRNSTIRWVCWLTQQFIVGFCAGFLIADIFYNIRFATTIYVRKESRATHALVWNMESINVYLLLLLLCSITKRTNKRKTHKRNCGMHATIRHWGWPYDAVRAWHFSFKKPNI